MFFHKSPWENVDDLPSSNSSICKVLQIQGLPSPSALITHPFPPIFPEYLNTVNIVALHLGGNTVFKSWSFIISQISLWSGAWEAEKEGLTTTTDPALVKKRKSFIPYSKAIDFKTLDAKLFSSSPRSITNTTTSHPQPPSWEKGTLQAFHQHLTVK